VAGVPPAAAEGAARQGAATVGTPTAAPAGVPTAAPQDAPLSADAIVGDGDDAPPPEPPPDDAWAEQPWPPLDPWTTATPQDADGREPPAPAALTPAASTGSEPRGLDLLRSVFPGRVLRVVSDASDAAADGGTGSAPPEPLDPDEAALDPDPGGPP
jgi:hypothetical protein